ncbi:TonB-dependent receptor [Aestuariibacter sp. A3R04]|uniref:TonB-dependent receptor n=1 Tax=Aestuariibacter sp. A3R04 TaxID=2841571 RepID=UPI001C0962D4|nr:TonB-dependent receptor [Aestuariibacter sp. A3R04]MBU3021078.1 TonB-dependent receptor [Aestuariibacter sp. A3R04]
MHNRTTLALALMAVFSGSAAATTITGKVLDQSGNPVVGAEVTLEGSRRVYITDDQGRYTLKDIASDDVHIHVSSPKHLHGDEDLGIVKQDRVVNFTLAPASIENIVVTATAMQNSVLESVTPVSVISADELRRKQQPTLGETLKSTPGVHSTYYGPVSSSPVIRGASGPRVKIVQNGLDVSDVSRIGPDHNVATSTSSATQVEVLRGPATLQYGSGAIGGVVNVVDKRIPQEMPYGTEGEAELRYSTVDNGKFGKVDVTAGAGDFAFHFDGFKRNTDDVDIPGYGSVEPDEDDTPGVLGSSDMETTNFTAGLSYIQDEGFIGFSVEQLDNQYGVPGHHHHHEDEHDEDEHDEDEHDEEHAEEGTMIDVDMTRYQMAGEWHSPSKGIDNVRFSAAYTDYSHVEIEDGEVGTEFTNESTNLKLAVTHTGVQGWHGVVGLQFDDSDYEANGEEAFSPPTNTSALALFLVEQKKVGDVTFEIGGRVERTTYDAADAEIELHAEHEDEHEDEHDEGHHDDEHEHEDHDHEEEDHEHEELIAFDFPEYDFTSVSLSAGANWEYQPGHAVALTLSRNERAPSQQELFSGGQHIATRTYEVGLVYQLDDDGELLDTLRSVEEEVTTNLDLTFRKFSGDWGYTVSVFYTQADNYIYESDTGLIAISEEHEHEEDEHEEEEGHDEHEEEGTPVYYFQQSDADLYGIEAETFVNLNESWRLEVYGDYIRAKLDNEDLPRIPPLRLGSTLRYQSQSLSGEIGVEWYDDQDKTAPFETATDGYTLLNASVEYDIAAGGIDWVFFASADNITDEEARVHTSFLKDLAPLPGRNFSMGVRAVF